MIKNFLFRMSTIIFLGTLTVTHVFADSSITNKKKFVFNHSLKDVWNSAQIILGAYPLETNDISGGIIKTTPLKPGQFWQAPFEKQIDSNYIQVMTFHFYELGPKNTHLEITKTASAQTDFLGSQLNIKSEPWEELRLVYKIKREIEIKKILAQIK